MLNAFRLNRGAAWNPDQYHGILGLCCKHSP